VYGKCVCACIIIHGNECLIITYISKYMRVMSNGPFCIFSSSKDFINHCVCVYTCIHSFIRMIHTYIHEYGYTHTHIFDTYIHMHVNLTCYLSLCSHDRFNRLHRLHRREVRSRDSFNRLHRLHRRQVFYDCGRYRSQHLHQLLGRQVPGECRC